MKRRSEPYCGCASYESAAAERDLLYAALVDLLPLVDDFVPIHALSTERFEEYQRLVTPGKPA